MSACAIKEIRWRFIFPVTRLTSIVMAWQHAISSNPKQKSVWISCQMKRPLLCQNISLFQIQKKHRRQKEFDRVFGNVNNIRWIIQYFSLDFSISRKSSLFFLANQSSLNLIFFSTTIFLHRKLILYFFRFFEFDYFVVVLKVSDHLVIIFWIIHVRKTRTNHFIYPPTVFSLNSS